ncbi:MAG: DUF1456 family protein [Rectinemataceae bacterium]|nr:DUF1456 family protein [Rectinemataceae bacterium]
MKSHNNDILIRIRYALNITDLKLVELFALADYPLSVEELRPLFLREEDEGFKECDGATLGAFLQGLVVSRRGKKETTAGMAPPWAGNPGNNEVLKALRIALELRDDDVQAILKLAGFEVSKAEIGALFRNRNHANYRPCGDQFLRNFLAGLTKKFRV